MSLTPQELLAEYRIAYRNANPHREVPNVEYSHGWFRFTDWGSGRTFRRAKFVEMLTNLRERVNSATAAANSPADRKREA